MENKRKTVEEFITKGERLMEDPKSPKVKIFFIQIDGNPQNINPNQNTRFTKILFKFYLINNWKLNNSANFLHLFYSRNVDQLKLKGYRNCWDFDMQLSEGESFKITFLILLTRIFLFKIFA